jgi:hypothetical protein
MTILTTSRNIETKVIHHRGHRGKKEAAEETKARVGLHGLKDYMD